MPVFVQIAGNTWGICPNGTEGMGCGEQEMFRLPTIRLSLKLK